MYVYDGVQTCTALPSSLDHIKMIPTMAMPFSQSQIRYGNSGSLLVLTHLPIVHAYFKGCSFCDPPE